MSNTDGVDHIERCVSGGLVTVGDVAGPVDVCSPGQSLRGIAFQTGTVPPGTATLRVRAPDRVARFGH
jgi:hypothetical protein